MKHSQIELLSLKMKLREPLRNTVSLFIILFLCLDKKIDEIVTNYKNEISGLNQQLEDFQTKEEKMEFFIMKEEELK